MKTLQEIETRMSEIKVELEKEDVTAESIDALDKEFDELTEQRTALNTQAETRKNILNKIANGEVGKVVEQPKEERKENKKMEENVLESKEYRSGYFKNLQGKGLNEEEQRALSTASNSAGAAVPTTTMDKIVEKLYQTSALYSKIDVTNIPGNVTFAVSNAQTDAAWKAEGVDGSAGDDTVATVTLNGYELIKLAEVSAAASAMTIDAFENYLVSQITKKMAVALENAILNGNGTGQPKGILAETFSALTYTKAAMGYKDITKIIAALPTMYHPNAVFTMPRKLFFEEVLGMVDTAGKPCVVADPQSPAKFNLIGYPVIINDFMPTDTILFGDFSYYKMNFSKPVEIESDKSVGFKSGKITYRGLAVVDSKLSLVEAIVKATRSAS